MTRTQPSSLGRRLVAALRSRPRLVDAAVCLLAVYVGAASAWEARRRPLWFDEIFTAVLTKLPSFADTQRALATAADTPAPGYYVLERLAAGLIADEHLALRIVSVLSVSVTCLCVYAFARREAGPGAGLIAALTPLMGVLYHDYSVEARPYAATVALAALGATAWQRAASGLWGLVLVLALAGMTAVNYYGVFALAPFALAEAARWYRTGRLAPAVPVALAAGVLPVVWWWPNLAALRAYYGAHYWSAPSLAKAIGTYDYVVNAGLTGIGVGVVAAVAGGLVYGLYRDWRVPGRPGHPSTPSLVLVLGFLALPVLAVLVSKFMQGGYTYRYALGTSVGVALGVAYAAVLAGRQAMRATVCCLLAAFAAHETLFWISGGRVGAAARTAVREQQRVLKGAAVNDLPVIVVNGLDFAPLAYYAPLAERARLVALVDPDAARQATGTDSIDRDLLKLREHAEFRVEDFDAFARATPRFLVFVTQGAGDWWHPRLRALGFSTELVARAGPALVLSASR